MKSPSHLELNWRFQAPKVRGFFRNKFLSFMKCFQIFINVNLPIFKRKKKFSLRNYVFCPKNAFTLFHIAMIVSSKKNKKCSFPYNLTQIGEWKGAKTKCILLFTPFQSKWNFNALYLGYKKSVFCWQFLIELIKITSEP